ncbi:amino-acid N-acetyltransferase [Neisseriaceae bacterium B1]
MITHNHFAQDFREAAPYIHYLRSKTIVVGISSRVLLSGCLNALAADFNLIAALGMNLVLVHGCTQQLRQMCEAQQHTLHKLDDYHVIDAPTLQCAKQVCGQIQFDLQAALSLGYTHAPQRPPRLRTASGNYLTAKPLGVLNGVDMHYAGQVRKVDTDAIRQHLAHHAIVLISPIAASPVGQIYALTMRDTAQAVAIALKAEKLIFLTEHAGILDTQQHTLSNLSAQEAQTLLDNGQTLPEQRALLSTAIHAVQQGIARVQILSGSQNGSLINELFTRQGSGTSIARDNFMQIRTAQERDIADIIALIRPLEERGILVHRSRAYLEAHIHEFSVLEHDRQMYGCVALKQFAGSLNAAELACLVVSDQVREGGYGDALLAHVVAQAKKLGKAQLFALSTQTADWFLEHGFQAAEVADLPPERQAQYHQNARQSKVFVLPLD